MNDLDTIIQYILQDDFDADPTANIAPEPVREPDQDTILVGFLEVPVSRARDALVASTCVSGTLFA